jgi:hypothetical protein
MSYTLVLQCGCVVYVACDPITDIAHTRVVERRGESCRSRKHDVGARIYLWEILPERAGHTLSGDRRVDPQSEGPGQPRLIRPVSGS